MPEKIEGIYLVAIYEDKTAEPIVIIKDKSQERQVVILDTDLAGQEQFFYTQFHASLLTNQYEELIDLLDTWKITYVNTDLSNLNFNKATA